MDAKELLKRYAAGERDFTGIVLRNGSYRIFFGVNLSNANFSNSKRRWSLGNVL